LCQGMSQKGTATKYAVSLGNGSWPYNKGDAASVGLPPQGLHLELLLQPARRGQKEITALQHLPYPPAPVLEEEL